MLQLRQQQPGQAALRRIVAQQIEALRVTIRPLRTGVSQNVRFLLSPNFSLFHITFRRLPATEQVL